MRIITFTVFLLLTLTSWSKDLSVFSFNVEWLGHGNKKRNHENIANLGKYIKSLNFSIICLQEVSPFGTVDGDSKADYREVLDILGSDYRGWHSHQGRSQRLVFIWNTKEVEVSDLGVLEGFKRETLSDGSGKTFPRIPFTCFVKSKKTGTDFRLITVHMTWGNDKARYKEALRLAEWYEDYKGESFDKDVIIIGDFNSKKYGWGNSKCK